MSTDRPVGFAPSAFHLVAGALAASLLLVIVLGAVGLTRDIADLRTAASDTARALAELRAGIGRDVERIDAEVRTTPGRPSQTPPGGTEVK